MRASSARFISFAHPPLLITNQPNRPTLRVGRPHARMQNVRVLSRRRKFTKAVACGYSEGAGFVRSNGTLPLFLGPSAPCGRLLVDAALTRCVPCPETVRSALSSGYHPTSCTPHTQPGPSAEATPRRRRGRDGVGAATSPPDGVGMVGSQSILALGGCHVGRPRAISRGREKRAATASGAEDTSPRPRRALPRAGALWFQSQRQR